MLNSRRYRRQDLESYSSHSHKSKNSGSLQCLESPRAVAGSFEFGQTLRRSTARNMTLPLVSSRRRSQSRSREKRNRRAVSVSRLFGSNRSPRSSSRIRRRSASNDPSRRKQQPITILNVESPEDLTSISYDVSEQSEERHQQDERLSLQQERLQEEKKEEAADGVKKRKSKMQKIRELQMKNDTYKEEFKRVQKERKHLKKEVEAHKEEINQLNEEIDVNMSEIARLKSQLTAALESHTLGSDTAFDSDRKIDTSHLRASELTRSLRELQEIVRRKDDQIAALSEEVDRQCELLETVRENNSQLMQEIQTVHRSESSDKEHVDSLELQNQKLQDELGSTLERAASMVKEREEAIADLLKENEEMKEMLGDNHGSTDDKHLRAQLAESAQLLEENQDRNILLEEEVEAWIGRGKEMDDEIARLMEEVGQMESRAIHAENNVQALGNSLKESNERATRAHTDAENASSARVMEMEIRLRAAKLAAEESEKEKKKAEEIALQALEKQHEMEAIIEAAAGDDGSTSSKSKYSGMDESCGTAEGASSQAQQSMLLEKALANSKKKSEANKKAWSLFGKGEPDEELSEDQKRIKELESANADQAEEILKLKSELVKLRTSHNETVYMNKKKIEKLEADNESLLKRNAEFVIAQAEADAQ